MEKGEEQKENLLWFVIKQMLRITHFAEIKIHTEQILNVASD